MKKKENNEKVQIGPKIPFHLKRDLDLYAINTGIDREVIVEMALTEFLRDKDLTPVVQMQLFDSIDITYDDPRFEGVKAIISMCHTTTANELGRQKLIKRLHNAYTEACKVGMCPELKMEYEEALSQLQEKTT